ncbi:MAG: alpha/beta fold hydrolase [Minwuia sp.]|uniref:alpha/beta fold hydrolase n=1 Tax=Minwuia sp. TaxID=2493630 RepID=UPI003A899A8E
MEQAAQKANRPPPFRQMAPRPLGLHLATAMTGLSGAAAAVPLALSGGLPWHPSLKDEAGDLLEEMRRAGEPVMSAAVWNRAHAILGDMMTGIRLYQDHPYVRRLDPPGTVWSQGSAKLFDYGGGGRPVLFVPSLVNRGYVLDLEADNSLLRWLSERGGVRPLLLDWGAPGDRERAFGLGDYVTGPLAEALEAAGGIAGAPVPLVGYCMGGTLVTAAAQLFPERVAALGLLAAPWDFHAEISAPAKMFASTVPTWRPVLDAFGEMPLDLLQSFFAALDPGLAQRKFSAFATMDQDSAAARHFVALEDWLNDGVPLTARVALETLGGWFGENHPATGHWLVGGRVIDPAEVRCPAFVAIPSSDRIVPPPSARALAARLPDAEVIEPRAGHIGMVVGSKALDGLWRPLETWLTSRS